MPDDNATPDGTPAAAAVPPVASESTEESNQAPSPETAPVTASAPEPAAAPDPAAPLARPDVLDRINTWFAKHFHNLGPELSTSLHNRLHAAKDELRTLFHDL